MKADCQDIENTDLTEPSELLRLAKNGDSNSMAKLIEPEIDRIFSMIMKMVGNKQISEELTQEVCMRAWKGIASFKEEALFSTWVTRIAINHTKNFFNSAHFKKTKATGELDQEYLDETPGAETQIISQQTREKVRNAVAELPNIYKEIIWLTQFEAKSYKETASILEIPIGTVSSRVNKALHLLKGSLGGVE